MLSLGKFSSQARCNGIILHNLVPKVFVFPAKTHHIQFSFCPNGMSKLGCSGIFARKRTGFCFCASKNQIESGNDLLEMDDFEDFDKDDDLFEDEEEGFEEREGLDDDEEFIPLNNMKKWMKNKPRGFGEGKVYDTSVEDKLMEEIEQSRRAQLANINKLKNNPLQPSLMKESVEQEKVSKEYKDGLQVRLVNLPKKKNIHRDLQLAFKGVPGILDIVPVVSGNKKTRDPICKGLAYIRFRSEHDAYRFVQGFTGKSIMFGKVQKQIKCEMATDLLEHGYELHSEETSHNFEQAECSFSSSMEDICVESVNQDNMHESTKAECDGEESEAKGQLESRGDGDRETKEESNLISSSSLKKSEDTQEKGKKVASEGKKKHVAKYNIPGSAKRLKIREKELLTGVFSKYGANTSATRERS